METDVLVLNGLIGVVIPLLVALVTAKVSSPKVKASALLVLSTVAGYLTTLLYADVPVDWENVGKAVAAILASAVISFFGLTKPWGLAGTDGVIQSKVSGGLFGKAA